MSRSDWESLATRLGLSYRPSSVPGRLGELNGILRHHRVLVRPDRPALYVEYRFRVAGLRLSTKPPRTRSADASDTGHRGFDRAFPTRQATGAARAALSDAGAFQDALLKLIADWRGVIAQADCAANQFSITLRKRGWIRKRAAMNPAQAEALLPCMLDVVEGLETALKEHAIRTAMGGRL